MSKERPFEDIVPVPNIKVGYFEKEAYLEIIDRQEKQIESFAYQIKALRSRIDILEKSQRPIGHWIWFKGGYYKCDKCGEVERAKKNFCSKCGVDMRVKDELMREENKL